MSIGMGAFNPFDLRYGKIEWAGLANPSSDAKGYCIFQKYNDANPYFWGLRAGFRDLFTKFSIDKLQTIQAIVEKFAPDNENDTEAYIACVTQETGWTRDETLDLHPSDNLKKLGMAFLIMEQGRAVADSFTPAQIDAAVAAALFRH